MTAEESLERAFAHAKKAIALMREHGVRPEPNNFALWYQYVAGGHPSLRDALDRQVQAKKPFTSEINEKLYERFLGGDRQALAVNASAKLLLAQLEAIAKELGIAGAGVERYGEQLATFGGALGGETPVTDLRTAVARIRSETKAVQDQNRELESQLEASASEVRTLRADLEETRRQAMTDPLTGLANRLQFDLQLKAEARKAQQSSGRLSLVVLDIDHFKSFNDNHGHLIGDLVLKLIARTLTECIKGKDTAARFGGEEFAIVLPDSDAEGARAVANSIRERAAEKPVVNRSNGKSLGQVTISAGVAEYAPGEALMDLIARADEALYAAKRAGRNRVMAQTQSPAARPFFPETRDRRRCLPRGRARFGP